ncbi:MAG: amidohydrolase [Gammaproteobacteria bacterium]|nr:amidohydrolase [Gammaproteobacteria bacterium]
MAAAVIQEIAAEAEQLTAWRRDLHAHPELAYQEQRTSRFVAQQLESFGLPVHQGLATTGVVATLSRGSGPRVGLRADMDALPMQEANQFAHRSQHAGKMHACGHDGHTVMLLAAARYLADHGDFAGTVDFIFQPAEEAAGGARVMMDDGLFDRFPVDAVFGMHNWPGLPVGEFAMRPGPMMASLDCFDLRIDGVGAHGALPHHGVDPILAASQVVSALQTLVSRNLDPLQPAVISITRIHAGDAYNIIPDHILLGGAIRCFDEQLRADLRAGIQRIATGVCDALGASATVTFVSGNPAVMNAAAETALAAEVAADIVGAGQVHAEHEPIMGSEDFAFMLLERPGCYVFVGNGDGEGGCMVHNPRYDFNDEILPLGATYWVRLAERFLATRAKTGVS